MLLHNYHTMETETLYNFKVNITFTACYDLTSSWMLSCTCQDLRREALWVNNIL